MRMGAYIAYLRHVYVGIRLRPKAVTFCSSDRHRDINSLFFFFFILFSFLIIIIIFLGKGIRFWFCYETNLATPSDVSKR